jgi:DNA-binding SARP family transcriptional activator
VQKPNEKDQIRQLKQQVAQLKHALGETQAENVVNRQFLKIACEDLGCDVDAFKKKAVIAPSARAKKNRN